MIQIKENLPENIQEGFDYWKLLPRHDGKGGINGERSDSDLANYRRALRDLCLGLAGHDNLHEAPFSFLALEEEHVIDAVLKGAGGRVKGGLKPHLASSLQSWVRALRRDLQPLLKLEEHRPKTWRELHEPGASPLPAFLHSEWPEAVAEQFAHLELAYGDKAYFGQGWRLFKRRKLRPRTLQGYRHGLNRLLEFCVKEQGRQDVTLIDLVDLDLLEQFAHWYLQRKKKGGYSMVRQVCFSVAGVARYLEIMGELKSGFEPFSKHPEAPWIRMYQLGVEVERVNHKKAVKLQDVPALTPQQMHEVARHAKIHVPRNRRGNAYVNQTYTRRRTAMFFALAPFMPIRLENWTMMCWGKHLYKNDRGRWCVRFEPEETKNGERRKVPRAYELELPNAATEWIEWWRSQLTDYIGADFEEQCPWVLPSRGRTTGLKGPVKWKRCLNAVFYRGIFSTCLEVRGHRYRTHVVRHDVATHIITRENATMRDIQQAATLLGDLPETVSRSYYKPKEQELLDKGYFSEFGDPAAAD
ncbi:hypothetical protein GCM10008955_34900 [Deinococcus malanensis]|uniref:Core-binding (CB) domain-containing protein n=2 Tax=Deinococcus malanensis TaxID=1706855 RepID=A0ABQ2F096_9DEIO|nr:hypothetical protein GCM10008955_34900 [Deinococcus malanensis]